MKALGALCVALLATPAFGDLPEPKPNHGATSVEVDGTRVTAEAWALAKGHDVDAIIVTRLNVEDGKPHKVESYERWSRDGKTKFERGSRALGRAWEKHLWAILDAKDKPQRKRKRKDLMKRALDSLGPKGEREVDGYVVAWTLTKGLAENGAKPSRARIAIFTYTPSGAAVTPPSDDPKKPGTVTPHEKAKQGAKPAPRKERPLRETPTTPRTGPKQDWPFPFPKPRPGGSGSGFASGGGGGEVQADSKKGVRGHARVTVDLGRYLPQPKPEPKAPSGPVTPKLK